MQTLLAPPARLERATTRLTAECSTSVRDLYQKVSILHLIQIFIFHVILALVMALFPLKFLFNPVDPNLIEQSFLFLHYQLDSAQIERMLLFLHYQLDPD